MSMKQGRAAVVLLGALALASAACTDLTEVVYDQITEENFNPTAKDLGALMAPAYTPLRSNWTNWYGALDYYEELSDVLLTPVRPNGWYDGGIYIANHQHKTTPASGQNGNRWTHPYSGITSVNRLIYQIESGVAPVSEALRPGIMAELRALRAYYYYLLLDDFGNVPIVTDFTDTELPQQSTRQQVYDFVISEFNAVMNDLSIEVGVKTYGRMNKWAAKAILARVYLNSQVYVGTAKWNEVLTLTQEIMDSGKYLLESNYRAPFAKENQNSKEIIFAVPYDEVNGTGSSFHMKTLKPECRYAFGMQAQPWGGSAANPQFIATYDPDDTRFKGIASDNGKGGTWLVGPHFDSQGRGYNFVQHVPSIDSKPGAKAEFYHGYPVWKYEIYTNMTGSSSVDFPIVRYAEVLMMRAEALLRTGQAAAAATLVTQVRQRAFAKTNPAKATVTAADLTQGSRFNYGWYDVDGVTKTGPGGTPVTNGGADIQYGRFLDELAWEFAVEGQRKQQLIRFGVFTKKTWYNHTPNGDYRALLPIPQARMQSNTNLKQNPGY